MRQPTRRNSIQRILLPGVWLVFVLLILPAPVLSSAIAKRAVIDMRPQVTVEKDPVLLGDIADIRSGDPMLVADLNATVVGRAPLPGESRQIKATYVALRLKQKGILADQITLEKSDMTTLERSSTVVSRQQIKNIISDALQQEDLFEGQRGVIREIKVSKDLAVPSGDITYRVQFTTKPIVTSSIPVAVSVFVDGTYYRKIWATLIADVLQEVLVLNHAMRRHQRITAENIRRVAMNIADLPNNAIPGSQNIVGKRVTKSLLSGTVLRTDTVELPPLVKRGDVVVIKATTGVLQVTTLGKAKSNGHLGERIKIVNLDTNKVLYGHVVDTKTVQIVF